MPVSLKRRLRKKLWQQFSAALRHGRSQKNTLAAGSGREESGKNYNRNQAGLQEIQRMASKGSENEGLGDRGRHGEV